MVKTIRNKKFTHAMRCGSMHPRIFKNVHPKYSSITLDFFMDILCPKV
jgi:hypothetical protein